MKRMCSVPERVLLAMILPKNGNLMDMMAVKGIMDQASLSIENLDAIEFDPEKGVFRNGIIDPIEVDFGEYGKEVVKNALIELEKQGQLPLDCLELWEAFGAVAAEAGPKVVKQKT